LQHHYQKTEAFASVHRKIHTDRFYRFLKYAGRRACVLLIKGDHDNDFPGDYDPRHISTVFLAATKSLAKPSRQREYSF